MATVIDTDATCSVNEAAALLGMTKWGVFAMLRDGRWLKGQKANGVWFIDRASVDAIIAERVRREIEAGMYTREEYEAGLRGGAE